MWLNKETKRTLLLALYLAQQWEDSVIDSYDKCEDEEAVRIKNERRANIYAFKDLADKIRDGE